MCRIYDRLLEFREAFFQERTSEASRQTYPLDAAVRLTDIASAFESGSV